MQSAPGCILVYHGKLSLGDEVLFQVATACSLSSSNCDRQEYPRALKSDVISFKTNAMSSALILSIGSRGDFEPIQALTEALLKSAVVNHVHLFMASEYASLVSGQEGITLHKANEINMSSFGVAKADYFKNSEPQSDPISAQRKAIGHITASCVTPLLPKLYALLEREKPSLILTTTLGALVAATLSEKTQIPSVVLNMQPNTPTKAYPCYMSSIEMAKQAARELLVMKDTSTTGSLKTEHEESYLALLDMFLASVEPLNQHRNTLTLPNLEAGGISQLLRGELPHTHMLHSYPTELVPRAIDINRTVCIVPPLADRFLRPGWNPTNCPNLVEYINTGEPPFCLSMGSLSVSPEELSSITQAILSGFRAANLQRICIVRGSGSATISIENLKNDSENADLITWAKENIFECSEDVQFPWLFSKCRAVLCHGGGGTVSTALRAGIPVGIAPFNNDQFFWGELVSAAKLGAIIRPSLIKCSTDSVRTALQNLMSEKVCFNCGEYGRLERARKSGCEQAVSFIAKLLDF